MNADPTIEAAVQKAEPAARFVSERHLRKVLSYLRDTAGPQPANPALPVWISREALRAAGVVGRSVYADDRPFYLLLTPPDDRLIDHEPPPEQRLVYRRLLFRAAVLRAIDEAAARPDGDDARLSPETCAHRLTHFGEPAGREIQFVLESDHAVDPESDAVARYRAFASLYLDLAHFHPAHLKVYFPSLDGQHDLVTATLRQDLGDVAALLDKTQVEGAAEPAPEPDPAAAWGERSPATDATATAEAPVTDPAPAVAPVADPGPLLARASEAATKGNQVRAAILHTRLGAARDAAAALDLLVRQLGAVLRWDAATQREWVQALTPLLAPAATGLWPRAARCLYELQKIPNELSHEVYAIDLPEYIRTFARRPVKRQLPYARDVLMLMHLKRAHAQLLRTELDDVPQLRLDRLFVHETARFERVVRRDLAPVIKKAVKDTGLNATDPVSKIARDKVVAELLDRVCDRGYLRLSDLRDAIARNQLKLPDLSGPVEFLAGNPLLRADVRLSYALDGVYRRGEFYLRWLQRVSGLFFGTALGRFLTLYLLLPFGGSFIALNGLEHVVHKANDVYASASRILAPKKPPAQPDGIITENEVKYNEDTGEFEFNDEAAADALRKVVDSTGHDHPPTFLVQPPAIVGFGVFLLLMFHAPPVRRAVFDAFRAAWRAFRFVVWDAPGAVVHSAAVTAVRKSWVARSANKYLSWALLAALVVFAVMWLLGASPKATAKWSGVTFAVVAVLANTPFGWAAQERLAEGVSDKWRAVRANLLPGLIGGILAFFRWLANWVERQLYAVDEWLRFRGGDSRGSIVAKALLGLVWFPIAYTARFVFYLLLEPQVNPVKHFPVVTVSHKMLLPLTVPLAHGQASSFGEVLIAQFGLGVGEANVWAFWIIAGIPGIFGFIAWELKENWRLYGANRADTLRPVTLGSHGETMRGLLRPGFHSGTVPRLYRKLRAAAAKGDRAALVRHEHDLHHAAEAVHRFAERELVPLLRASRGWERVDLHVGHVHFGCMRVVIDLEIEAFGTPPFRLGFENRHGRVEATVVDPGWFDKLSPVQAAAFVSALQGLLDMAAAELHDGAERGGDAPDADPKNPFLALRQRCGWDDWVVKWRPPVEGK